MHTTRLIFYLSNLFINDRIISRHFANMYLPWETFLALIAHRIKKRLHPPKLFFVSPNPAQVSTSKELLSALYGYILKR